MSSSIGSATHKISAQVSDTVLAYLESVNASTIDRCVQKFFLDFISKRDSYLKFDTFISYKEEFDARDFTRYVTKDQRIAFSLRNIDAEEVNDFVLTLQSKGGIAKIAADLKNFETFPAYALIAQKKRGDVSEDQVTSLCMLSMAIKQFIKDRWTVVIYEIPGARPIHYFIQVAPLGLIPPLRTYSILENKSFIQKFFNLTDHGIDVLVSRIKSKPDSEQHYHTIELPLGEAHTWSPGHHRVMHSIGLLHPVVVGESELYRTAKKTVMVVPSFSMFQEYANVFYGKNALPLVPLLGECTKETIIHFKLKDKRPFHVGMDGIPVLVEADGNFFGPLCYTLHDFYHLIRDMFLTKEARKAVCHMVKRIFSGFINEKTEDIRWKLMDGELVQASQHLGHVFTSSAVNWDDAHKRAVLRDMATLPAFWKSAFKVTPELLLASEKETYDSILPTITQEMRTQAEIQLFNYYQKAVCANDPEDHYRLGKMYAEGMGTQQSYPDAIRHWELSGQDDALLEIGICFDTGLGVVACPERAVHYFRKAAKTNPQAQFKMGCFYYFGQKGLEQNYARALFYYKKAAEQGHGDALHNLGTMYCYGESVKADLTKGFDYIQQADRAGSSHAHTQLGVWYYNGYNGVVEKDLVKALAYFKKGALKGQVTALLNLGIMHRDGIGVARNLNDAFIFFRTGADIGDALCQVEVANMYLHGKEDVVEKDVTKALMYYHKAEKQENGVALFDLSLVYLYGWGVEKNPQRAFGYLKRSADGGNVTAQAELAVWYFKGDVEGVPQDFDQAFKYWSRAAQKGHIISHFNLGILYQSGQGVEKNLKMAFHHFNLAAEAGDSDAQNKMGIFYFEGEFVEKNISKAVEYFERSAKQGNIKALTNLEVAKKEASLES